MFLFFLRLLVLFVDTLAVVLLLFFGFLIPLFFALLLLCFSAVLIVLVNYCSASLPFASCVALQPKSDYH